MRKIRDMKESRDIFQAIEGVDEDGEAKAICCLMVEQRFGDISKTSKVQRLACMQDASVRVNLTGDFAVVDLGFEGCADYDYLQAFELCREFTAMTDDCEQGEKTYSALSLILYIIPKGECDFFLMGMDAAWSLISEKPGEMCSAIRFVFVREEFGGYEFEEETVKQMDRMMEESMEEK